MSECMYFQHDYVSATTWILNVNLDSNSLIGQSPARFQRFYGTTAYTRANSKQLCIRLIYLNLSISSLVRSRECAFCFNFVNSLSYRTKSSIGRTNERTNDPTPRPSICPSFLRLRRSRGRGRREASQAG